MSRLVARRELLGLAMLAPVVSVLRCESEGDFLDLRSEFPAMAAAQQIGQWVLDAREGSKRRDALWQEAFGVKAAAGHADAGRRAWRKHFLERVSSDFEQERTLLVASWLLSKSEAALFAYLRRSYPLQSAPSKAAPPRATLSPAQLAQRGARVYPRAGCPVCHDLQQDKPTAPALTGLWKTPVRLASGQEVTRDEAYLRRALLEPAEDVVHGYTPSMPTPNLGDDDVDALVAYLKTLSRK